MKYKDHYNHQDRSICKAVAERIDPPSTKRKLMRYVIPMREASFLPGEETGVSQFGKSGKGRFFPADFFFANLELRGSKLKGLPQVLTGPPPWGWLFGWLFIFGI